MQTLEFIGRGSAFNIEEGNNSAYIKKDNKLFLIDCGENIFERIIKLELLNDIKEVNIAITHCHSDHIGSLSSLILYCYYIKHIKCNLYVPDDSFITLIESMGVSSKYCDYYEPNEWINLKEMGLTIAFIPAKHVEEINSYSLIISLNNKKQCIYYSGDTSEIHSNLLEVLFKSNEILEFYQDTCLADYKGNVHTSLRKLCELIPRKYRNKIYCMHLDCNELIKKSKLEGFNVVELNDKSI